MEITHEFVMSVLFACVFSVVLTAGIKKQIKIILGKGKEDKLNRFITLVLVYVCSIGASVYLAKQKIIDPGGVDLLTWVVTVIGLASATFVLYDTILKNVLEAPNILTNAIKKKLGV